MKKLKRRISTSGTLTITSVIANFQGEFFLGNFIRSSLTSILGFNLLVLLALLKKPFLVIVGGIQNLHNTPVALKTVKKVVIVLDCYKAICPYCFGVLVLSTCKLECSCI